MVKKSFLLIFVTPLLLISVFSVKCFADVPTKADWAKAKKGVRVALFNVGEHEYYYGDKSLGYEYLKSSANKGYAPAMDYMGSISNDIFNDSTLYWWTKSAEAGYAPSINHLAWSYEYGENGAEMDDNKAYIVKMLYYPSLLNEWVNFVSHIC